MTVLHVRSNQADFSFDTTVVDRIRLGLSVDMFSTSESGGIFRLISANNRGPSVITYQGTNDITLISGFGGEKTLTSGVGNDTLMSQNTRSGSANFDVLTGGAGDDVYDLRTIFATIVEAAGEGIDTVRTGIRNGQTFVIPDNVENVFLKKSNDGNVNGNALDNEITANTGNNVIRGFDGNDTVFGRAGEDRILGGDGDDSLDGGMDNDILDGGNGDDTLTGGLGNDELLGKDGNDELFGGDGNDTLEGAAGDDILEGGVGDDVLMGTQKFNTSDLDTLTGGAGNDSFVLGNATKTFYQQSGFATITDFEAGDEILVSGSVGNYTVTSLGGSLHSITTATSTSATDLIALVTTVGGATVTLTSV